MIVVIRDLPGSAAGERAIALARDAAADLVLLGDGILFGKKGALEGFCGTAYVLDADLEGRLPGEGEIAKGVRVLNRDQLSSLLEQESEVIGL